jgi:hypothetical protein
MKSCKGFFLAVMMVFTFCGSCYSQQNQTDRQPAVAGQFYPSNPAELNAKLKNLFSKAVPSKNFENVAAVIAPHAGYVFSGEVAASDFNQIDPNREYENIFVIGSSHHVLFDGASIYRQGNFVTPSGIVKVNRALAEQLIKKYSFFSDRADAHVREHSLEVQLPFLQYRLKKDFQIVPIVLGTQSPEMCGKIADALRPYFGLKNLFIISTDFAHYPGYNDAVKVDKATTDAILSNSPENLIRTINASKEKDIPNLATSLCGWTSVLTLLYITRQNPAVSLNLIDYKNSGDAGIGDKNRVVGYNAIVVSLGGKTEKKKFRLSEKDKKDLLSIARETVKKYIGARKIPDIDVATLSENLKTNCGAFVTLRKNHALRGCIGRFEPNEPLYKVVQQMAVASSTEDHRFSPVESKEVDTLDIEISVLTPMRKISSIDEIEMGRHGIYIKKGIHGGTFLPQVAQETGWTKEQFLGHCAQDKAGIGWNGWKDADIYIYEAFVFSEKR